MPLTVLSVLDTVKTRYYHFKAIIVAGMGIFTDAYDLFCIPPITRLLGHIYYKSHNYQIPHPVEASMLAVALLGTMIGQLILSWLGDRVGRGRMYGLALMLMMAGSIGCGLSMGTTRGHVLASLVFFRFLLRVGVGGDYPLSVTIMSECVNKRMRGTFIPAVFSMLGFGILVSSIITMAVCKIFGRIYPSSSNGPMPKEADIAWRLILMLGAVPAAITYYWRMMPEKARHTALVELNVLQAARDVEPVLDVSLNQITEDHPFPPSPPSYPLFSRQLFLLHGRDLLACSATWFLLDIAFYGSNLCQSHIFEKHHNASEATTAFEAAFRVAKLQAIVACCFTIPCYFVAVFLIDRVGRVRIQVVGFVLMAIVYFSISYIYWDHHTGKLFMILYGLTFFFANCEPNTTTFVVPAELFPARFRLTCHGIAGAAGNVGAMTGSVGFLMVSKNDNLDGDTRMIVMLIILGGISVVGMTVTTLFTRETMRTSLEENEKENKDEPVQGK